MKIIISALIFLVPLEIMCQCTPQAPALPAVISRLGRTLTFSNVSINSGANYASIAPGASFTVSFDFNVSATITACPGCITYFYFGVAGTSVPGSPSSTTYPNTECFGSVYAGQTGTASATFTAPLIKGFYYITIDASWTYWCHQYAVSHNNCFNNAIALIVVGNPPVMTVMMDSIFDVSACGLNDGRVYLTADGGAGCYKYAWSDGSTSQNLLNATAGSYEVTVSDGGCDTVLNFMITEPGFGFSLPPDTTLCTGDFLVLNIGGFDSISWKDGASDSIYAITVADTFWVDVWSGNCVDRDSIIVNFDTPVSFDLGSDTAVCTGDVLQLTTGINADTYLWQDGSSDSTFLVSAPGIYSVTATSRACTEKDSIEVFYDNQVVVNLGKDTVLCDNDTLQLHVEFSAVTYQWQDGSTDSVFMISSSGNYWVEVRSGACLSSDTIAVGFDTIPIIDKIMDATICENDSIIYDATFPGALTYTWSDGSTDPTLMAKSAGGYWVDVNTGACVARDSAMLSVDLIPVIGLDERAELCEGDSLVLDLSGRGDQYLWQNGSTNSSIVATASGIYWAEVGQGVCSARDSIELIPDSKPQIELGEPQTLCEGDGEVILDAGFAGSSYVWQDNSVNSYLAVSASGVYSVAVTNNCGTSSDSVTITYENCSCEVRLPQAFTPNGDGRNDMFRPLANCQIGSFNLKIFNRWGQVVFESESSSIGWDGTYKGEPQPIEQYVWVMDYRGISSSATAAKRERGTVTLIR